MLAVKINAIKTHSLSENGNTVSLIVDAQHVGELSMLMAAEGLDEMLRVLNEARQSLRPKSGEIDPIRANDNHVSVRMPRKWTVTADLQKHNVVVLIFDHKQPGETGYALDAESAKQIAAALIRNGDAIIRSKAGKK